MGKNSNPRWLWHAIDNRCVKVLAYILISRINEVFMRLKALLEPFGISHFYTDGWGAYERQGNRILIEFSNYCKCLENLTAQFQL